MTCTHFFSMSRGVSRLRILLHDTSRIVASTVGYSTRPGFANASMSERLVRKAMPTAHVSRIQFGDEINRVVWCPAHELTADEFDQSCHSLRSAIADQLSADCDLLDL